MLAFTQRRDVSKRLETELVSKPQVAGLPAIEHYILSERFRSHLQSLCWNKP